MTLDEIRESTKDILTPADIADVLGCDKYSINVQVSEDIKNGTNSLRFPWTKIGTRVRIPREGFINFMEGKYDIY